MGWTCKTKASVDYAAMTTETAALDYRINWSLNQPATVAVWVNDDSGGKSQTYDTTYLGTSALLIEQPTATEIFRGRIVAAEPEPMHGHLILRGEDWLGQLADRRVNFDTREDLGNGYREATMLPYKEKGVACNAVRTTDLKMMTTGVGDFTNDEFNNMKLVVPHKYLGSQTETVYAYDEIVTATNPPMTTDGPTADGEQSTWAADGTAHEMEDDSGFYVVYYFRSMAQHSIGSAGGLVASIDKVTLTMDYKVGDMGAGVVLYDFVAADYTIYLRPVIEDTDGEFVRRMWELPADTYDRIFDSGGYARVAVVSSSGDNLQVDYIVLTVEYTVDTAHNDTHTISDTINSSGFYNRLILADDVEADGFVDYWPYSITQAVTVYVASLVGAYDELYALSTADVAASTNYVCRHFHRESPLQILKELARADNTDFWLDPWDGDSLDLHWNDPYNVAGAPTWSDTDVLHWTQCGRRLSDVTNEWFIDGLTSGDYKVSGSDSDANSITDYGRRTGYFNNPDIAINQEATDEADRRVARMKDARFNLGAVWDGFKTTTLGSVVHVHSTKFNLDTDYVVVEKEYESRRATTSFMLTPRATVLNPPIPLAGLARRLDDRLTNLESRLERGERYTEVWS